MYRIVIVDREPLIRSGLRTMIVSMNLPFEAVAEWEDGMSAMEKIREHAPHVVLTEVQPAGGNGLTFPERLHQAHPQIRIVLVSGYRDVSCAERAARAVGGGLLVKPVEPEELHAVLRRMQDELESGPGAMTDAIDRAKRYIRQYYFEDLRLESVAEHLYMNPAYFSSLFKKETDRTFTEYLTELRMCEAKKLLMEGEKIEDIAYKVGYGDQKAFCRAFKRTIGCSPAQFKAAHG